MRKGLFLFFFVFVFTNGLIARSLPISDFKIGFHAFHISKCQIEYNLQEKALQMSMHIFIDDLEEALRNQGSGKLFIGTEKESDHADEYLLQYLHNHFHLKVNEQIVAYEFVGKETSEDLQAIWCYLEITNIESVKSVTVENSLLMEVFADQKNIIHIMMPNNKQGYFMLEKGKSIDKATF